MKATPGRCTARGTGSPGKKPVLLLLLPGKCRKVCIFCLRRAAVGSGSLTEDGWFRLRAQFHICLCRLKKNLRAHLACHSPPVLWVFPSSVSWQRTPSPAPAWITPAIYAAYTNLIQEEPTWMFQPGDHTRLSPKRAGQSNGNLVSLWSCLQLPAPVMIPPRTSSELCVYVCRQEGMAGRRSTSHCLAEAFIINGHAGAAKCRPMLEL